MKIQKLIIKNNNKTLQILGSTTPEENTSTETNTSESNTSNEGTQNNDSTPSTNDENDKFKKSDVYLSGKDITVDYIVDGNLFICADSVTIKSQIGGDAFVIANSITIEEQGSIYSNLFAISKDLNIKGVAYDVYGLSDTSNISGYIYRDLKLSCFDFTLSGNIARNAFINCNSMNFTNPNSNNVSENTDEDNDEEDIAEEAISETGKINGNLYYSSPKEITIPEGVVIGEKNYTKMSTINNKLFSISSFIMTIVTAVVTTIIIWLLCILLAPKFINKSQELVTKKVLPILGFGILTPIALIIASIILIMLNITSYIGLIALLLLLILLAISTSISVIVISYIVCDKLKFETKLKQLGVIAIISIVLSIVKLIPFIGSLIGFVASILGLGLIAYNIIFRESNKLTDAK